MSNIPLVASFEFNQATLEGMVRQFIEARKTTVKTVELSGKYQDVSGSATLLVRCDVSATTPQGDDCQITLDHDHMLQLVNETLIEKGYKVAFAQPLSFFGSSLDGQVSDIKCRIEYDLSQEKYI